MLTVFDLLNACLNFFEFQNATGLPAQCYSFKFASFSLDRALIWHFVSAGEETSNQTLNSCHCAEYVFLELPLLCCLDVNVSIFERNDELPNFHCSHRALEKQIGLLIMLYSLAAQISADVALNERCSAVL